MQAVQYQTWHKTSLDELGLDMNKPLLEKIDRVLSETEVILRRQQARYESILTNMKNIEARIDALNKLSQYTIKTNKECSKCGNTDKVVYKDSKSNPICRRCYQTQWRHKNLSK